MNFHYITAKIHLALIIDGPNPVALYERIVVALGHKINIQEEMQEVVIDPLFEKTNIQMSEFKSFCDQQCSNELWQLYSQIRDMPEHACFLFFPGETIKDDQLRSMRLNLIALERGLSYQEVQKSYDDFCNSPLMQTYQVVMAGGDSPMSIGNPEKANRVCRLCGRSESDGATFKMRAHAISELLGNKTLFLYDECDACNNGVVSRMESSVATFFKGLRVMLGVRGKTGIPSVDRLGQKIHNNGAGHVDIRMCVDEVQSLKEADGSVKVVFKVDCGKYVPQHIYRMLSKYAISVLPNEVFDLLEFEELRFWIRGCQKGETALPMLLSKADSRHTSPSIVVYKRKAGGSCDLPLFLADFSASGMRFLYELPFVEGSNKLTNKGAWKKLFEKIPSFGVFNEWNCEDFSLCDEFQLSNRMILKGGQETKGVTAR